MLYSENKKRQRCGTLDLEKVLTEENVVSPYNPNLGCKGFKNYH